MTHEYSRMSQPQLPLDHSRCQRWRKGRDSYRPAGEVLDTGRFSVEAIEEGTAKSFVTRHHYSGSYPAARVRAGLFEQKPFAKQQLVGAAIFSVPMNPKASLRHTGQDQGVELGRFVLLDEVPANAESWFLARALRLLSEKLPGMRAVLSYSDPVPRRNAEGIAIMPGHLGTIYQASNAHYAGRATPRTLVMTRSGHVLSERTLSKLRADDRGAAYAYEQMLAAGAPRRNPFEDGRDYVRRALADGPFTRLRHPGNHLYIFALGNRRERRDLFSMLEPALPYPKALDRAA